jgi:hemerythrin-like metal-binding protein
MDETHREFAEIVNRMARADKAGFIELFPVLVAHTQAHFVSENALMKASGFPAIREHMDEHQRVLGELRRMAAKTADGSTLLARAYVAEQLPAWFSVHAVTMDSALAGHLKQRAAPVAAPSRLLH